MSGSGREALSHYQKTCLNVRERSGGPPGCPGVVGSPTRMFESGRAVLTYVRDVREWSGSPLGCPGVVRRSSSMSGSGREALPDVWERSRGLPGYPGVLGRPSWLSSSGQEGVSGPIWEEWAVHR